MLRLNEMHRLSKLIFGCLLVLLWCTMAEGPGCSLSGQTANCVGLELEKIPPDLPANVINLDLKKNRLASIGAEDLSPYCAVVELFLNENQLTWVDGDALLPLPRLVKLDLSNNQLTSIPKDVFRANGVLEYVMLSGNSFASAPSLVSSSLAKLELRICGIREVAVGTFSAMPNLVYLELWGNQVAHLDASTFEGTKLMEVYVDVTSGVEEALVSLCRRGAAVRYMQDHQIREYCDVAVNSAPLGGQTTSSPLKTQGTSQESPVLSETSAEETGRASKSSSMVTTTTSPESILDSSSTTTGPTMSSEKMADYSNLNVILLAILVLILLLYPIAALLMRLRRDRRRNRNNNNNNNNNVGGETYFDNRYPLDE